MEAGDRQFNEREASSCRALPQNHHIGMVLQLGSLRQENMAREPGPFQERDEEGPEEVEVRHREEMLDEALAETFPASDPVSLNLRHLRPPNGPPTG